ncbi:copper resistance CopC/CopD family protein [Paenibacillus segetis]|nr:copper resistance protein CopC [Paenibacillus segetis]
MWKKWSVILCLFGCLFLSLPEMLSAHAYIISSSPTDNEILTQSPDSVYVIFNEPIEAAFQSLTVIGPSGERVDQNNSSISSDNPAKLSVDLQSGLPEGVYSLKWKALSGDGHNVSGTIAFQIGNKQVGEVNQVSKNDGHSLPSWDLLLVRWLQYSGMALFIGGLIFHLFLLPHTEKIKLRGVLLPRSKVMLLLGFGLTSAGILLNLPQQAASDAGVSWSKGWNNELISETLRGTTFGEIWGYEALLLLVLSGLIFGIIARAKADSTPSIGDMIFTGLAFLCSLGILLCKAFIGHASVATWKNAAVTANFLHLSAASLWIGGLLSLAFLLPGIGRHGSKDRDLKPVYWETIGRFSLLASICVVILLATGIYGSLIYVPTPYALFHTDYGQILLAKGFLMLVMLALGLSGFLRGRRKQRSLGSGIWIEFGTGILVLFLAAILANLPTAASSPGPPILTGTAPGGYKVTVNISPNTLGMNHFKLDLQAPDGKPLQNIEQITLKLTSKEMDMGVTEITFPGDKLYEADELITMAGRWNVSVHVLLKSLDVIDLNLPLTVGH